MLSRISIALNNFTKYSFIALASTQIIYGFKTRKALDLLRINVLIADTSNTNNVVTINFTTIAIYLITRFVGENNVAIIILLANYRLSHVDVKDAIVFVIMRIKN